MACSDPDLGQITSEPAHVEMAQPSQLPPEGDPFLCSDNAEQVTEAAPRVLAQHRRNAATGNPSSFHQVFLWHQNETHADRELALTIENTAAAGQALRVSEVRAVGGRITGPLINHGQRVACALLDPGAMTVVTPPGLPLLQPGDRAVLWHTRWNSAQIAGA